MMSLSLACGRQANTAPIADSLTGDNASLDFPADDAPSEGVGLFEPELCSKLAFDNVVWPSTLTDYQINTFALAMNITGSFEGSAGWSNLSNNFDGQGVSLGLFNQNLGQGSLQPLMIQLRDRQLTKMKSFYSKTQFDSLNAMLTSWGGGVSSGVLAKQSAFADFYENDFSDLDDPELMDPSESRLGFSAKASNSKNAVSVNWAVKNIYSGSSFKTEWKNAFKKMAASPEYVSLQVAAAKSIHDKTMGYMKKFAFKEMRAYLFFFDIVVQNGGISTSIADKYLAWAKQNSKLSESAKLKKLLEYRLTVVIAKYRNDVKARKTAVIDGAGTVHGSQRVFSKEYCAPSWNAVFPKTSLL